MLAAGPANRVRVKRGRLSRRIRCARTLSTSQSANDSQPVRMPKLAVEAANVVPGQLLDTAFPVKSTEDRLSIMTAHGRADPRRQNFASIGRGDLAEHRYVGAYNERIQCTLAF